MKTRKTQNRFIRAIKKFLLSAFVILSFGAYALEHGINAGDIAATPAVADATTAGSPASSVIYTPTPPPITADGTPASAIIASPTAVPGSASSGGVASPAPAPTAAPTAQPTTAPTAAPTATSAPVLVSGSGLKDGTFVGPTVDVRWGLVQVQATVRGGQLTDVQFLQYPRDRRTSQRINSQADPWLQQEAIQAQSANVDIISGATLTSEGFAQSLQGALDQASS